MRNQLFRRRLRQLRFKKGVDAKTMSLDLHMTKNYIYNIENGYAYPSMTQFFAICEYLDIAPHKFMIFEPETSSQQEQLLELTNRWTPEQMDQLICFAKKINENR